MEKLIVLMFNVMNQLCSLMIVNIMSVCVTRMVGVGFDIMAKVFILLIMVTVVVATPVGITFMVSIVMLLVMMGVMGLLLMSLCVQVLAMMVIEVSMLSGPLCIQGRNIICLSCMSISVFVYNWNLVVNRSLEETIVFVLHMNRRLVVWIIRIFVRGNDGNFMGKICL